MRRVWPVVAALSLSGCTIFGARPLDFTCRDGDLHHAWASYATPPLQQQIQADAYPPKPGMPGAELLSATIGAAEKAPASDVILQALQSSAPRDTAELAGRLPHRNILMLSGGAGWGAFGAGFLANYVQQPSHQRFDVITGVSTGALQSLRVALGEYEELVADYTINHESDLAIRKGLLNVVRAGYLYDSTPLRTKLERMLCENDCRRLRLLAGSATPPVLIGTVDLRSGDFAVVDVKKLLRGVLYPDGREVARPDPERLRRATQCLVGVTMASAAVPVSLRPVRLGGPAPGAYHSYADGGVRLSLFEAQVARAVRTFAAQPRTTVTLFALRNGPTIVRPAEHEPNSSAAKIDVHPDAMAVALRSYSIIVNQTEVASIATLRLIDPVSTINFTSADGYDWQGKCTTISEQAAAAGAKAVTQPMFDPQFMKCLSAWGRKKEGAKGWVELRRVPAIVPPVAIGPLS